MYAQNGGSHLIKTRHPPVVEGGGDSKGSARGPLNMSLRFAFASSFTPPAAAASDPTPSHLPLPSAVAGGFDLPPFHLTPSAVAGGSNARSLLAWRCVCKRASILGGKLPAEHTGSVAECLGVTCEGAVLESLDNGACSELSSGRLWLAKHLRRAATLLHGWTLPARSTTGRRLLRCWKVSAPSSPPACLMLFSCGTLFECIRRPELWRVLARTCRDVAVAADAGSFTAVAVLTDGSAVALQVWEGHENLLPPVSSELLPAAARLVNVRCFDGGIFILTSQVGRSWCCLAIEDASVHDGSLEFLYATLFETLPWAEQAVCSQKALGGHHKLLAICSADGRCSVYDLVDTSQMRIDSSGVVPRPADSLTGVAKVVGGIGYLLILHASGRVTRVAGFGEVECPESIRLVLGLVASLGPALDLVRHAGDENGKEGVGVLCRRAFFHWSGDASVPSAHFFCFDAEKCVGSENTVAVVARDGTLWVWAGRDDEGEDRFLQSAEGAPVLCVCAGGSPQFAALTASGSVAHVDPLSHNYDQDQDVEGLGRLTRRRAFQERLALLLADVSFAELRRINVDNVSDPLVVGSVANSDLVIAWEELCEDATLRIPWVGRSPPANQWSNSAVGHGVTLLRGLGGQTVVLYGCASKTPCTVLEVFPIPGQCSDEELMKRCRWTLH